MALTYGVKDAFSRLTNALFPARAEAGETFPYNHVELVWWRPPGGFLNFGDVLSKVVVERMLDIHGHSLRDETTRSARLLAVGSILHFAKAGDTIWGTGVNGKISIQPGSLSALDVRATRGPMTRDFLLEHGIAVPKEIFGDPALLLPHLLGDSFRPTGETAFVVVPNLHDLDLVPESSAVVSPLLSWTTCIERILEARLVLGSSLHALVVAEAYGIPARFVRFSGTEHLFKYTDYALGTGRRELEYARSVEEGLEMGGMLPISFDPQLLFNAFPLDLWQ